MALNVAYEVKETRSFVRINLVSLALTVGLVVVLLAGATAISLRDAWDARMTDMPIWIEILVRLLMIVASLAAVSAVIAAIYQCAPDRPTARWYWITPGSTIATVGAIITIILFAVYVANFGGYTATYGALGAIVVLLMWLWLTSLSLCIGAEVNGHLERLLAADNAALNAH